MFLFFSNYKNIFYYIGIFTKYINEQSSKKTALNKWKQKIMIRINERQKKNIKWNNAITNQYLEYFKQKKNDTLQMKQFKRKKETLEYNDNIILSIKYKLYNYTMHSNSSGYVSLLSNIFFW